VGAVMVLLPILYMALMVAISYGLYYHATENMDLVTHTRIWERIALLASVYFAPLVFGTLLVIFMIKPLFAPRPVKAKAVSLNPYKEDVLFDFIHEISGIVKSPMPRRVEIDCHVNVTANFDIGFMSLYDEDLVLKLGLPLVAGLNTRQFAGVLARELGRYSQITGTRLPFIIRNINHWFSQIVRGRDVWDKKIENWSQDSHFAFRAVLHAARFFIWISRKILWIFMKIGHMASCSLMRRMDLHADGFQTRLTGTNQFLDTSVILNTLNVASEQASADLWETQKRGLVVDNLPDLILSKMYQMSPSTEARFKRQAVEVKTGFFDSRPSYRDRIVNAFKEDAQGIFKLDVPTKGLFSDFNNLSRQATEHHYQNDIGLPFKDDKRVSLQAFTRYRDDLLHGREGIERSFFDTFNALRPLSLQIGPEIRKKPVKQRMESLLKSLHLAKKTAPKAFQVLKNYDRASEKILTLQQAKLLLQADLSIDPKAFKLPEGRKEVAERALKKALTEKSALESLLRKVEALLANRFELALSLLDVPQISKYIKDAGELKKESAKLLRAYLPLSAAIAHCEQLNQDYISLGSLAFHYLGNQDNETLTEMIQKMKTQCKGHLGALYDRLKDIPYPFDNAQADISMAEHLMTKHPEEIDGGAIMGASESVLHKMIDTHTRLLGRLAVIAGTAEKVILSRSQKKVPKV